MGPNCHQVLSDGRSQTAQKGSSFVEDVCRKTSSFDNVIFTDECSIHMENHGKLSFHCKWEPPKLKGHSKHPFKVHVWAGISKRGSTKIIFSGNMDAHFYVTAILAKGLLPFITETFPDGHRFQQDNDSKHESTHP